MTAGAPRPPLSALRLHPLPALPQREFDHLLWSCDLNFVRGEDSLVRALWAGQPFVWQIYPQHDDAHHAKLDAFLDWLRAPPSLRAFHRQWNGIDAPPAAATPVWPGWTVVDGWLDCVQDARARLLAQPDLGSVVVMFVTSLGMLFLAGARLVQFIGLILVGVSAVVTLVIAEPYRMRRVTSFLDPWADPFGSGYQLTQSLMAFGRGSWFGQGLGNSVQKLEYLPEAHTDFIFAVIAEETGLIGVFSVLCLLFLLVSRALWIGNKALFKGMSFHGFLAYALAIWIGFQTCVNVGVASGVLPTKGLTLPFISSGGSSLIIMLVAAALLIRIDFEVRLKGRHAISGGPHA